MACEILKFHTICQYIVRNKIIFCSTSYSACVVHVYTKTITKTSVSVKVMDIYLCASQLGKYPSLFTSTSVNNKLLNVARVNQALSLYNDKSYYHELSCNWSQSQFILVLPWLLLNLTVKIILLLLTSTLQGS